MKQNLLLLTVFMLLVACSPDRTEPADAGSTPTALVQALDQDPPTASPPPTTTFPSPTLALPTSQPTNEPPEEPTATSETSTPNSPPATRPSQPVSGQTADGAYFFGAPDAPLTIIDYSDFL